MSKKITELDGLTTPAGEDTIAVVDFSDIINSPKEMNFDDLFGGMPKSMATKVVAASDTPNADSRSDYQCDGTADDVQIQAAIDALPAAGGPVRLLEGTYHISATIELDDDAVLEGLGDVTNLELDDSVDATFLTNRNTTPGARHGTGNYRITVRNLKIDGNKTNQGAGLDTLWCVGFSTVEDLRIENITVFDGWTTGVRTEFCTNVVVTNSRVDNPGDDGIAINKETYYATVSNNIISNCGGAKTYGSPRGIEVQDGAHDVSVVGNTIEAAEDGGIQVTSHAAEAGCYRVSIVGNSVDQSAGGAGISVSAQAGAASDCYGVALVGNTVESGPNAPDAAIIVADNTLFISIFGNYVTGGYHGIRIDHDAHSIVGNTVMNCLHNGIFIQAATDGCMVSGNYVADNDIGIANFGDNTLISGNKLENTASGTAQRYGVVLYINGDDCRVIGNSATGHTVQNYLDSATGSEWVLNVGGYTGQIYAHSIANVTDPPTDAEIDAIFGTPATVGPGFMGLIDDNDAHTKFWLCVSSGANWLYEELTKAV